MILKVSSPARLHLHILQLPTQYPGQLQFNTDEPASAVIDVINSGPVVHLWRVQLQVFTESGRIEQFFDTLMGSGCPSNTVYGFKIVFTRCIHGFCYVHLILDFMFLLNLKSGL